MLTGHVSNLFAKSAAYRLHILYLWGLDNGRLFKSTFVRLNGILIRHDWYYTLRCTFNLKTGFLLSDVPPARSLATSRIMFTFWWVGPLQLLCFWIGETIHYHPWGCVMCLCFGMLQGSWMVWSLSRRWSCQPFPNNRTHSRNDEREWIMSWIMSWI